MYKTVRLIVFSLTSFCFISCNETDVPPVTANDDKVGHEETLEPETVHKYFVGNVTPENQTEGN